MKKRINIILTKETLEIADYCCNQLGISKSQFIRFCIIDSTSKLEKLKIIKKKNNDLFI